MSISAREALRLIAKNAANSKFKIIDVRTLPERQAIHIPNSQHIPLNQIPQKVGNLSRENTYLIYCRAGIRSLDAALYMRKHGLEAINMEGGIIQWQKISHDPDISGSTNVNSTRSGS